MVLCYCTSRTGNFPCPSPDTSPLFNISSLPTIPLRVSSDGHDSVCPTARSHDRFGANPSSRLTNCVYLETSSCGSKVDFELEKYTFLPNFLKHPRMVVYTFKPSRSSNFTLNRTPTSSKHLFKSSLPRLDSTRSLSSRQSPYAASSQ